MNSANTKNMYHIPKKKFKRIIFSGNKLLISILKKPKCHFMWDLSDQMEI